MNAANISAAVRPRRLEGIALTALLINMPTFTGAAMGLKLWGDGELVSGPGAMLFVALTSLFSALLTAFLGPRFPRFFKSGYQPVFFDGSQPLRERLSQWLASPNTALQLLAQMVVLSLLGVALASA